MDSITLENFRCFREKQTARLAPLTLLVGENSTGKTSFMAMIRALWDVAYQNRVPDFKEEPYDLGSFDEIAHHRRGKGGRADTLEAGFDVTDRDPTDPSTVFVPYRFEVTFGKKGAVPVPVRRYLAHKEVWIEDCFGTNSSQQFRFGISDRTWQRQLPVRRRISIDTEDALLFSFSSLLRFQNREERERDADPAVSQDSNPPTDEDWRRIEGLTERFRRISRRGFNPRPYASAPVRSKPHRTYDPARPTRDPEGDYIPMYLANIHFQKRARWNALKSALEGFGRTAGLFDELSVKQLGKNESEPFQIQVRKFGNRSKGPQRNLIDVGYGVSQALPIITELLRRDAPPMLLLQQPEVHLHPSAQAALGTLFCQIARQGRQLIVETHSDHLLDRVRMDVRDAETKLKPEDVSILFFERDDLDVRIHSLRFDEEGNVLDAPPSYRQFFMEEMRRSLWKR